MSMTGLDGSIARGPRPFQRDTSRGGLSLPHDNPPRARPSVRYCRRQELATGESHCDSPVGAQLQPLVEPQPSQT